MEMLKPVDVVVLGKVLVLRDQPWNQPRLARELGVAQTNIHRSLKQLEQSHLLDSKTPQRQAFFEFATHAIKYVYPATLGPISRGVPTGHLLGSELVTSQGYVWPADSGSGTGTTITPLHACVPGAALRDPQFHHLMSLLDVFRTGRVRELALATKQLSHLLGLTNDG